MISNFQIAVKIDSIIARGDSHLNFWSFDSDMIKTFYIQTHIWPFEILEGGGSEAIEQEAHDNFKIKLVRFN